MAIGNLDGVRPGHADGTIEKELVTTERWFFSMQFPKNQMCDHLIFRFHYEVPLTSQYNNQFFVAFLMS